MPCLFVPDNGPPLVLVKGHGRTALGYDSGCLRYREIALEKIAGTAVFFSFFEKDSPSLLKKQPDWFRKVLTRFVNPLGKALLITFFLNILALILPIFTMTIYDQVQFFEKKLVLVYLGAGILIFILSDFGLRLIRSSIMAFVSARLGDIVGNEVFRRLLYLPPPYTESAAIGSQYARIKDFDTVQEFFSGPALTALMELPFIVLLLCGMVYLGGVTAYVPLAAIAFFFILALTFNRIIRNSNEEAGTTHSKRQILIMEILTKLRAIKFTGATGLWLERYKELSGASAYASYRSSHLLSSINNISQSIVVASGVGTMAVGVLGVLSGRMTMGALMASMFLAWRILAPLRTGFGILMQFDRVKKSVEQINRLMAMDIENRSEAVLTLTRKLKGKIAFSSVSLRYSPDSNPALLGVDFLVEPNEVLAIVGHDGAGKSTVLKLILSMYQPQAGRILIDNTSLGQIDPLVMRRSVAYAPQSPSFFYGTIAQNLRFACPSADDRCLRRVCAKVGVLDEILSLPGEFESRFGDHQIRQLPSTFWMKLNLARTLVKDSSLYLFDETLDNLGPSGSEAMTTVVHELRKSATVILVTAQSRFARLADKVLWLDRGHVRAFGRFQDIDPTLLKLTCEE